MVSGIGRPETPRDITTLRVKPGDGTPTLLLKMRYNDTIGTVRDLVLTELRKHSPVPYADQYQAHSLELRSVFPSRIHRNYSNSLFQEGLTPNANLVVRILGAGGGHSSTRPSSAIGRSKGGILSPLAERSR